MKNLRSLILLFTANSISGFAQGITVISIPWHVVHDSGFDNANKLVIMMALSVNIIVMFWGLFSGTIVDKYNRKYVFLGTSLVNATILIAVSSYGWTAGHMPFALLFLIYTLSICSYNIHFPNLYAICQELFEPRYYGRINSAIELQHQVTNVIGMTIGGLLISGKPTYNWWPEWAMFEKWEMHEIFFMDCIAYLVAFSVIIWIRYQPSYDSRKTSRGNVWNQIRTGFTYLWENKPLFIFGVISLFTFFSLIITLQAINPIYISQHLKADGNVLTSFNSLYSIGAIIAGFLGLSVLIKKGNTVLQVLALLSLTGCIYLCLGTSQSITIFLACAIPLGICNAGTRILRITYIVRIVPTELIGRVNASLNISNVIMRVLLSLMLMLPFFSDEGNGPNIYYAFLILSIIMFIGVAILLLRYHLFLKLVKK